MKYYCMRVDFWIRTKGVGVDVIVSVRLNVAKAK